MNRKYEFVRFKSLLNNTESEKWWFVAKSIEDVNEHTKKYLFPSMQEGFNCCAKDAIDSIFKYEGILPHPTNEVAAMIEVISGMKYENSPMAFFNTANEMLHTAIKQRICSIDKGKTIYLEDGVREFGYNEKHFKIIERVFQNDLVYPNTKPLTVDDVRYIQWDGGKHWYAKLGHFDVIDKENRQKWNTKKEAEEAAKWFIENKL